MNAMHVRQRSYAASGDQKNRLSHHYVLSSLYFVLGVRLTFSGAGFVSHAFPFCHSRFYGSVYWLRHPHCWVGPLLIPLLVVMERLGRPA